MSFIDKSDNSLLFSMTLLCLLLAINIMYLGAAQVNQATYLALIRHIYV